MKLPPTTLAQRFGVLAVIAAMTATASIADARGVGQKTGLKGGKKAFVAYGADPANPAIKPKYPMAAGSAEKFADLGKDPAHGDEISDPSIREAMAGLQAQINGKITSTPISRGPAEIEFYDATGQPYDVKTPPSPAAAARWRFNPVAAGKAIIKQLRTQNKRHGTDTLVDTIVILDCTYLNDADYDSLWKYITDNQGVGAEEVNLDNIIEVITEP